ISASDHAPMPVSLSEVMLYAFHPSTTAPAYFLPLFVANIRLRGGWPSPQCASASARYDPRFHAASWAAEGSHCLVGINKSFQALSTYRWLKGKTSVLSAFREVTGCKVER